MSNSLHKQINRAARECISRGNCEKVGKWRTPESLHKQTCREVESGYQKGLLATALMSSLNAASITCKKERERRSNDIYGDVMMMMMSLVAINLGVELTAIAAVKKRERNRSKKKFKLNKEPYTLILPSFCHLLRFNEWHAFNHTVNLDVWEKARKRLAEQSILVVANLRKKVSIDILRLLRWVKEGSWKVHSSNIIFISILASTHVCATALLSEKDMFLCH